MTSTEPRTPSLAMPDQRFDAPFIDPAAPGVPPASLRQILARGFVLGLSALLSLYLGSVSLGWFTTDRDLSAVEIGLGAGTVFACFWVAMSVATATLGFFWRPAPRCPARPAAMDVAILLPMYGEPPEQTIGNAVTLLQQVQSNLQGHRFSLHILSDTRTPEACGAEAAALRAIAARHPHLTIAYHHRDTNTDYKSGNIRDWVRAHGAAHESMLILDADSVMGRGTVLRLVDALAADPGLGLVQSLPRVLPGRTLWQQLQSFASHVYGVNLGRGYAVWTGNDGNFLGHNAVTRTRAFAACAGLPQLPGKRPMGGVILSHDFVEAALLRRAGWGVRILPEATASFEETPETVIGYVRRDSRWCQGNMQHLRLLTMPGLHPVSRFHLLQGAMGYLGSVRWLALLILWAMLGEAGPVRYFSAENPAMPLWPVYPAVTQAMLAVMVTMLLLGPKVIGIAAYLRDHGMTWARLGLFSMTVLIEVVLSILMAPMLMVHQVRAVIRSFAGFDAGWMPHVSGTPSLRTLARFHATETALGFGLIGLAVAGMLTPWMLPVAVCLMLAVPLSWLVAQDASAVPLYAASGLPHPEASAVEVLASHKTPVLAPQKVRADPSS